jgi:ribosomal protein S15P/S13E
VLAWSRGDEVTDGMRVHPDAGPKQALRDVFVYFDDDVKVRAPHDALNLTRRIAELTDTI